MQEVRLEFLELSEDKRLEVQLDVIGVGNC